MSTWQGKIDRLSTERKADYDAYNVLKATSTHGARVGQAMECETKLKESGELEQTKLWTERSFENHGALYLDAKRYERYIMQAKSDQKPWMLMFIATPYGSNEFHYQTYEVILPRLLCMAQNYEFNLGIVDFRLNENIFESFQYEMGDYGNMVPYYIYVKDKTAYHMEQKLYDVKDLAAKLTNIEDGTHSGVVESITTPRNAVNIFWEYAKKDVGKETIKIMKKMHTKWLEGGPEHWLNKELNPYFGKKVGDKRKGFNAIVFVGLPVLGVALLLLSMVWSILCCIFCKKKDEVKEKEE
jgi:hypothetical protein